MEILALNCGSSSIKYKLFDTDKNYKVLVKGMAERIGQKNSFISQSTENNDHQKSDISLPDHRTAMHALHNALAENKSNYGNFEIDGVGHRIVHGGDKFKNPLLINDDVIEEIKRAAKFAPLHCQPNITGIEVSKELLPDVSQVAVFDTAAHQTLEPKAYLYGLPAEYYQKYGIRKYGFHGINHQYVANKASEILDKPLEELKIITCHLGNGCSITAFCNGKSIDTSMGMTPLEGLVMGTRCGDLDPAVVLFLIDELGLTSSQVSDLLNKKSGLAGLCGKNDMRDIIEMTEKGNKSAQTAIDVFVYRIRKYIGAYAAAMNGVDAIVFTGGIGENSAYIRKRIMTDFSFLGIFIDQTKNKKNDTIFSSDDSAVWVMSITANEELAIAKETYKVITTNLQKVSFDWGI